MKISYYFFRIKAVESFFSTKKDFTILAPAVRAWIKFIALQSFIHIKVNKGFIDRIKLGQSLICAQPEISLIVAYDTVNNIVWQSVFLSKMFKYFIIFVKFIQSAVCPQP